MEGDASFKKETQGEVRLVVPTFYKQGGDGDERTDRLVTQPVTAHNQIRSKNCKHLLDMIRPGHCSLIQLLYRLLAGQYLLRAPTVRPMSPTHADTPRYIRIPS